MVHPFHAQIPALLLNDTRVDRHHGCSRVVKAIHALGQAQGIRIVHAIPAHTEWQRDERHLRAFKEARVVIVNGEGSIHHDRPQGRYLLEAGRHARSLGIPAALINTSWQANGREFAGLLKDFRLVSTRDERSATEVRAIDLDCHVVPDLSLHFEVPDTPAREGIGFTDAVVRDIVLHLDELRRKTDGRTASIQYSGGGIGGAYRFFRDYVGAKDLGQPQVLLRVLLARAAQFRAQCDDDDAFMRQIAGLQLLVTARFHAAAFSLAAHTPALMVRPPPDGTQTDSNKLVGLLEAAGLEPWRIVAPPEISEDLLLKAATWHGDEKLRLERFLHASRRQMRALFTSIATLAEE